MSTRSITMIDVMFDEYDWEKRENVRSRKPVARFYRHCDGYPEGNGADLAVALALVEAEGETNNRNLSQHFLKMLCRQDIDIEFEPPAKECGGWEHGDLEYIYRVTLGADYTGGKTGAPKAASHATIEVWDCWGDACYADAIAKDPVMSGGWRDILMDTCRAITDDEASERYYGVGGDLLLKARRLQGTVETDAEPAYA